MAIDDLAVPSATAIPPNSSPHRDKKSWWRGLRDWCSTQWAAIRPGPEARRGGVWGTLVAAAICVVIGGLYIQTGFGYVFDFVFCILFAAIFIPLAVLLVVLLLSIARKLPRYPTGVIVGSCMVIMTFPSSSSPIA